ncbi:MAG TPA: hypothetical protein VFI23_04405 [Rhizomicrobium sp.]|nr:hypothetical protein [Rhizomicrobium sp.]
MRLFVAAMSGIACCILFNPAMGAESCVSRSDAMALKTAAVQQQLMVAAFMCHDTNAYNRFVHAYQTDLQESDASLKSYFVHRLGRRSEAAYDTYKTKVANLSALSQAKNSGAFCGAADHLFAEAQESRVSLSSFVEDAPSPPGFRSLCVNAPAKAGSRVRLHLAQTSSPGSR